MYLIKFIRFIGLKFYYMFISNTAHWSLTHIGTFQPDSFHISNFILSLNSKNYPSIPRGTTVGQSKKKLWSTFANPMIFCGYILDTNANFSYSYTPRCLPWMYYGLTIIWSKVPVCN